MKILVLGSTGQLGRCLCDQFFKTKYEVIYTSKKQIDITDFKKTKNSITEIKPDVIINASAYTAVDKAEEEIVDANMINNLAVQNIAKISNSLGCWLIHISTDYVFDGKSNLAYKETSITNPKSVYGKTKLLGEKAIQNSECNFIIIRTSWVYSEYGNNFLKTMLRLGSMQDELRVVGDQFGCPTHAKDLASSIIKILTPINNGKAKSEIYNYCGDKSLSWYEFADYIFQQASEAGLLKKYPTLIKVDSIDFTVKAPRPKYSVLSCNKIYKHWGIKASDWEQGVINTLKILSEIN